MLINLIKIYIYTFHNYLFYFKMNFSKILLLLLALSSIQTLDNYRYINLSDAKSTLNGSLLTKKSLNGVSIVGDTMEITEPGTYVLNGAYNGQVWVKLTDSTEEVTLVFSGATITNKNGPGVLITSAREFDKTSYSRNNKITYAKAKALDFSNAGVKVVIADDTTNVVNGASTSSYDGAFYSKVSMVISGETKGNGVLTVVGSYEGLDSEKHLKIEGGVINVSGKDDGVNTNLDYGSVTLITGGKVTVNGGDGSEGDGIDSNGMIIITGGEVTAAAKPGADSGLDSDVGTVIDGGRVIGVGSTMDGADEECSQPAMNLEFNSACGTKSVLKITDANGNELFSFSPATAGFVDGSTLKTYTGATVSIPEFKLNTVYHVYLDGVQQGFTSNSHVGPTPPHQSGNGFFGHKKGHGKKDNTSNDTIKSDFVLSKNMMYFSGVQKYSK